MEQLEQPVAKIMLGSSASPVQTVTKNVDDHCYLYCSIYSVSFFPLSVMSFYTCGFLLSHVTVLKEIKKELRHYDETEALTMRAHAQRVNGRGDLRCRVTRSRGRGGIPIITQQCSDITYEST